MIEWLRSFFFNAGVFKGTVRSVLMSVGSVGTALSVLNGLPWWVTAGAVAATALGGFLRSSQHQARPLRAEIRKPSPVQAPTPPPRTEPHE